MLRDQPRVVSYICGVFGREKKTTNIQFKVRGFVPAIAQQCMIDMLCIKNVTRRKRRANFKLVLNCNVRGEAEGYIERPSHSGLGIFPCYIWDRATEDYRMDTFYEYFYWAYPLIGLF